MFKKLAQQYIDDPDSIPEEYLKRGYDFLAQYCSENDLDLTKFVKNVDNIPVISSSIFDALDWKVRLIIKQKDIQAAIEPNHKWIIGKFNEFKKTEKKAAKPNKSA